MTKAEKVSIILLVLAVLAFPISEALPTLCNALNNNNQEDTREFVMNHYETTVEYTSTDLSTDTVVLDISDSPTLALNNGDLTYWKFFGITSSGVSAAKTTIASYVKNFRVLSYTHKKLKY